MAMGKRLKLARQKRGRTQTQLAEAMVPKWTQAGVSALEARDSDSSTKLFDLAKALRVSAEWLLTGRGESGLDAKLAETPDKLLLQLIDLYGQLSPKGRDQLLNNANWLHAREHPAASASNPWGTRTEQAEHAVHEHDAPRLTK